MYFILQKRVNKETLNRGFEGQNMKEKGGMTLWLDKLCNIDMTENLKQYLQYLAIPFLSCK